MSTGDLFSMGDVPKQKETKCEKCCQCLKCLKQCKQSRELLVQQF